jgi:hypothetical protein
MLGPCDPDHGGTDLDDLVEVLAPEYLALLDVRATAYMLTSRRYSPVHDDLSGNRTALRAAAISVSHSVPRPLSG